MTGEALWHQADWLTGLGAGWQIKASRDTNTIETVMETRDRTQIMSESERGFTCPTRLSQPHTEICHHSFTHCVDLLAPKFFKLIRKRQARVVFEHTRCEVGDHPILYFKISPKNDFTSSVSVALWSKLGGIEMSFEDSVRESKRRYEE